MKGCQDQGDDQRRARIGTRRIAIPLSRQGVRVHGVDGTFRLAYLLRNTVMNLTIQDAQVACFQNVAAELEPGGCFVIEVGFRSCGGSRRARRSGRLP